MDVIKFRGKAIDGSGWVVGSYIEKGLQASGLTAQHTIAPLGCYPIEVAPETIGQYRPSIDAFDGDWVKAENLKGERANIEGFLAFDDMCCVIEQNCNTFPVASFSNIDVMTLTKTGQNIHDNPELKVDNHTCSCCNHV